MKEIVKRCDGYTLWRGQDAEGRRVYGYSIAGPDGTAVEPQYLQYTSLKEAKYALARQMAECPDEQAIRRPR